MIEKSLLSYALFRTFVRCRLNINMRAKPEEVELAQWLLQLGDGTLCLPAIAKLPFSITFSRRCVLLGIVLNSLVINLILHDTIFYHCASLCPLNKDVRF